MTAKEHHRRWYIKNRARKIAQVRQWQEGNPESIKIYRKKWNDNNKEYIRQHYLDKKKVAVA